MVTLAGDPDDDPTTTPPPRPDVFVLRHLTWPEVHAATLGLVGALVALAFVYGGLLGQALGLFVSALVALVVLFDVPAQSATGGLLGRETWYFLAVFTVSALATGRVVA